MWTDDPIRDWDRHCEQQERELAKRQICNECGHPITDDYCYNINGEYICESCMNSYYMVETPVED